MLVVPLTDSIFKWKLSLEEPSLAYAVKANATPVLFVVGIPYPLFKLLQEYMVKQHEMHKAAEEDKPGGKENHCPNQGNLDYVEQVTRTSRTRVGYLLRQQSETLTVRDFWPSANHAMASTYLRSIARPMFEKILSKLDELSNY